MKKLQITNHPTDNPKLRYRELKDGRLSLYLDYYLGCDYVVDEITGETRCVRKRTTTWLEKYLYANPQSKEERQHNNETLKLARVMQQERIREVERVAETDEYQRPAVEDFYEYFQQYIDDYTKDDKRQMVRALRHLKKYLKSTPKYKAFSVKIKPNQLTKPMLRGYADYMLEHFKGSGPHTLWSRFKKFLKYAYEDGVFRQLPYAGIKVPCDDNCFPKEVLTIDEIKKLAATMYEGQNKVIRRAFIFCCFTGLRRCDVAALTWENIRGNTLVFRQNKTKNTSSHSTVELPLDENCLALIGEMPAGAMMTDLIFMLPSDTMCNKALKHWVQRAGINKHITWHCARHSFGTNLAFNDTDMRTIMSLMGHSSLKYTQRYVRAADSKRKAAMQSISFSVE